MPSHVEAKSPATTTGWVAPLSRTSTVVRSAANRSAAPEVSMRSRCTARSRIVPSRRRRARRVSLSSLNEPSTLPTIGTVKRTTARSRACARRAALRRCATPKTSARSARKIPQIAQFAKKNPPDRQVRGARRFTPAVGARVRLDDEDGDQQQRRREDERLEAVL